MRLIGTLPDALEAKRFCDFLVTQRVACHIEPGSAGGWQLWIEHDDAVDVGRAELEHFRHHSDDPRYAATSAADRIRREQLKAAVRRQQNYRDVRTTMFAPPSRGGTPLTVILVAICILVSFMTGFGQNIKSPALQETLFYYPPNQVVVTNDGNTTVLMPADGSNQNIFYNIERGQVWRLITPIFLHFGLLHLGCDVLFLWQFGQAVERMKGSLMLLLIVLLTAIVGNTAEAWWIAHAAHGGNLFNHSIFGGISGVDAGLFGYVWMCGKFRPYERLGVTQYEIGVVIGWLVLCSIGYVGPIANAAHWGGLLIGMGLGVAPTVRKRLSF